ncbi:28S ribosomal protein S34, mitochondrial [Aplysia californica]|uniref:28S ribosomal protein S34, mitochondrial n=1 Tax=Aplysia californica TaxID=6500 RepID=A0ABM0K1Z9_APLCA|nr:28S ribosomal protein S34, mitochondrial [Aplysia californica]
MPVRYIGRDPFFKGKSLYEICRQLRNLGEGRIVTRTSFEEKWPTQKTYVRLTQVIPDMSCPGPREPSVNQAWGFLVYRGEEVGEVRLTAGHKPDWRLIPKEEEADFCRIAAETAETVEKETVPKRVACPPLLEMVQKQELSARGEAVPDQIQIPYVGVRPLKEIKRHLV